MNQGLYYYSSSASIATSYIISLNHIITSLIQQLLQSIQEFYHYSSSESIIMHNKAIQARQPTTTQV